MTELTTELFLGIMSPICIGFVVSMKIVYDKLNDLCIRMSVEESKTHIYHENGENKHE